MNALSEALASAHSRTVTVLTVKCGAGRGIACGAVDLMP